MTGRKDPRDMTAEELTEEMNVARHGHAERTNRLNHAEAVLRERMRRAAGLAPMDPWSPTRVGVVK